MRQLAANIGALLTTTAFERLVRFALYALVARQLGVDDFGRLALAISILQLVGQFAAMGIPVLITRRVAQDSAVLGASLPDALATLVVTTVAAAIGLLVFIGFGGYEGSTALSIALICTAILPFSVTRVTEAVLVGLGKAQAIALVNVPVNLVHLGVAAAMMSAGLGVSAIVVSLAGAYLAMAVAQSLVIGAVVRPQWVAPRVRRSVLQVKEALPFLGIEGTVALRTSSTLVVVSLILGETAVGLIAAAMQLRIPLRVIGAAVGTALFPVMVRAYRAGLNQLLAIVRSGTELSLAIVLPAVVGIALLADEAIDLVYSGDDFGDAAAPLRILVFGTLAMILAGVIGRGLVAADRERTTLAIAVVTALTQLVLVIVGATLGEVIGVAVAVLCSALVNVALHAALFRKYVGPVRLLESVWRPFLATLLMAAALWLLGSPGLFLSIAVGCTVYIAALSALIQSTEGGISVVKKRFEVVAPAPED